MNVFVLHPLTYSVILFCLLSLSLFLCYPELVSLFLFIYYWSYSLSGCTMVVQNMFDMFDDPFDVTKCLQQIEIPDLHHMCAPCFKLPSSISTMGCTKEWIPKSYGILRAYDQQLLTEEESNPVGWISEPWMNPCLFVFYLNPNNISGRGANWAMRRPYIFIFFLQQSEIWNYFQQKPMSAGSTSNISTMFVLQKGDNSSMNKFCWCMTRFQLC